MSKALDENDFKMASTVSILQRPLPMKISQPLLQNAVVTEEEKSSLLFSQGDPANRFYIILEGRVKLFTANEEGEESIVEIFNPVTSFAEAAMFASKTVSRKL